MPLYVIVSRIHSFLSQNKCCFYIELRTGYKLWSEMADFQFSFSEYTEDIETENNEQSTSVQNEFAELDIVDIIDNRFALEEDNPPVVVRDRIDYNR